MTQIWKWIHVERHTKIAGQKSYGHFNTCRKKHFTEFNIISWSKKKTFQHTRHRKYKPQHNKNSMWQTTGNSLNRGKLKAFPQRRQDYHYYFYFNTVLTKGIRWEKRIKASK
jgi:hypothetical protein